MAKMYGGGCVFNYKTFNAMKVILRRSNHSFSVQTFLLLSAKEIANWNVFLSKSRA